MPTSTIKLNAPKLTLALTQLELDTGPAYECQISSAVLTSTAVTVPGPATGCRPAVDSAGPSKWAWNVSWLQDWQDPTGLSRFAFDNDAATVWYRFEPDPVLHAGLQYEGQCDMAAGDAGGTFGDGSEIATTKTWNCKAKPTVTYPAALAATATTA